MMKKGASLIWAVVLCSIMLLVVSTMSLFIVKESKMSIRMDDSARAYAAAESGIDWAKLCLGRSSCKTALGIPVGGGTFNLNNGNGMPLSGTEYSVKYYVKIVMNAAGEYTIRSRGESNNVNREIEYSYEESITTIVDRDLENDGVTPFTSDDSRVLTDNVTADGSFTLKYFYWTKGAPNTNVAADQPNDTVFGLENATANDRVGVKMSDNTIDLYVTDNSATPITLTDSGADPNSTYALPITLANSFTAYSSVFIELKYLRDTSYRLTVMQYDPTNGSYECVGTKTFFLRTSTGLRNFDFSSNTKFMHKKTSGAYTFNRPLGTSDIDSKVSDPNNYIYRFIDDPANPSTSAKSYINDISSSGISYGTVTSYSVTGVSSDAARGSVSASASTVSPGGSADLTATANPGFVFSGWSGDCSGSTNPYPLTNITSNKSCTASFAPGSWVSSAANPGIQVFNVDSSSDAAWKTANTPCIAPYCSSGILSSDNGQIYPDYPARDLCRIIGGRLPTRAEFINIISVNNANGGVYGAIVGTHWTSEEYDADEARVITVSGQQNKWFKNHNTFRTRCVK